MSDFRAVVAFSLAGVVSSLLLPEPYALHPWPLHQDLTAATEISSASAPVVRQPEAVSETPQVSSTGEVHEDRQEREADRWLHGVLERSRE